jgi:hypothetical protein
MSDPRFSEHLASEHPVDGRHEPEPPPEPFDRDAALHKYLALLDDAIEWCFDRDRYDRGASAAIGSRLIKASIAAVAALNQTPERQFTHRIVVEHITPPHLPEKNLKTIPGVRASAEPQNLESQG